MELACAMIADVTMRLKRQYRALLAAAPGYGEDKRIIKEMDTLGLLIKELEDGIVILQIKLDVQQEAPTIGSSAENRIPSAAEAGT